MIPASMIESLVSDREIRKHDAVNEVSSKWGSDLVIAGPILSIPYTVSAPIPTPANGTIGFQQGHYLHILPSVADFDTRLDPSVRTRGIYDVIVYGSDTKLTGKYDLSGITDMLASRNAIPDFKNAILSVGLSDPKGIQSIGKIRFGGIEHDFIPGVEIRGVLPAGVSTHIDITNLLKEVTFESDFSVRGSESVKYVPVGKQTTVSVRAPWKSPSFDGAFLPVERELSDKGFVAKWKILDFNRDFPAIWDDNAYSLQYIPISVSYQGNKNNWNEHGTMDTALKMSDRSVPSG